MTRALLALALLGCEGELRLDGPDASAPNDPPCTSACPIAGQTCAEGRCVECSDDRQCGGDLPRCDVAGHRCVQCGSSADCKDAQKICEPQTKRCLYGCVSSSECDDSDAKTCDPIRKYCVACATKSDCAADRVCDTRSGQCVMCLSDADCTADPEKRRCDPAAFQCVKCTSDEHCKGSHCDYSRKECAG